MENIANLFVGHLSEVIKYAQYKILKPTAKRPDIPAHLAKLQNSSEQFSIVECSTKPVRCYAVDTSATKFDVPRAAKWGRIIYDEASADAWLAILQKNGDGATLYCDGNKEAPYCEVDENFDVEGHLKRIEALRQNEKLDKAVGPQRWEAADGIPLVSESSGEQQGGDWKENDMKNSKEALQDGHLAPLHDPSVASINVDMVININITVKFISWEGVEKQLHQNTYSVDQKVYVADSPHDVRVMLQKVREKNLGKDELDSKKSVEEQDHQDEHMAAPLDPCEKNWSKDESTSLLQEMAKEQVPQYEQDAFDDWYPWHGKEKHFDVAEKSDQCLRHNDYLVGDFSEPDWDAMKAHAEENVGGAIPPYAWPQEGTVRQPPVQTILPASEKVNTMSSLVTHGQFLTAMLSSMYIGIIFVIWMKGHLFRAREEETQQAPTASKKEKGASKKKEENTKEEVQDTPLILKKQADEDLIAKADSKSTLLRNLNQFVSPCHIVVARQKVALLYKIEDTIRIKLDNLPSAPFNWLENKLRKRRLKHNKNEYCCEGAKHYAEEVPNLNMERQKLLVVNETLQVINEEMTVIAKDLKTSRALDPISAPEMLRENTGYRGYGGDDPSCLFLAHLQVDQELEPEYLSRDSLTRYKEGQLRSPNVSVSRVGDEAEEESAKKQQSSNQSAEIGTSSALSDSTDSETYQYILQNLRDIVELDKYAEEILLRLVLLDIPVSGFYDRFAWSLRHKASIAVLRRVAIDLRQEINDKKREDCGSKEKRDQEKRKAAIETCKQYNRMISEGKSTQDAMEILKSGKADEFNDRADREVKDARDLADLHAHSRATARNGERPRTTIKFADNLATRVRDPNDVKIVKTSSLKVADLEYTAPSNDTDVDLEQQLMLLEQHDAAEMMRRAESIRIARLQVTQRRAVLMREAEAMRIVRLEETRAAAAENAVSEPLVEVDSDIGTVEHIEYKFDKDEDKEGDSPNNEEDENEDDEWFPVEPEDSKSE